jgi:hypothetical protein
MAGTPCGGVPRTADSKKSKKATTATRRHKEVKKIFSYKYSFYKTLEVKAKRDLTCGVFFTII